MPRRRKYLKGLFKVNLKKKTVVTLIGLGFILLSGLIVVSMIGDDRPIGIIAREIQKIFGFTTIFLVVALTLSGLYLLKLKPSIFSANTAAGFYLFTFSLLSLGGIVAPSASGSLGRFISDILTNILSTVGAVFILLILLLVSIVIFFNTSFDTALEVLTKSSQSSFLFLKNLWSSQKDKKTDREPSFETKGMEDENYNQKAAQTALATKPVTNLRNDKVWEYPPLSLLSDSLGSKAERGDVKQNAAIIERTLENFGIQAKVVEVNMGPAVTQYALEIALGTKLTKITTLSNDIALALKSPNGMVRIEAPIPGKSLVGIEVPNIKPEIVTLKSILTSTEISKSKSKLSLGIGLDVSGKPIISNLSNMPHMLVAGSTGSGKSVAINAFISTILFRATPEEVKFIMVDPKMVELSQWGKIPHLLTPVITDPKEVLSALNWSIDEMTRRYNAFKEVKVRNIDAYNEAAGFQSLFHIVLIIDEFAHLMHYAPIEVENAVTKLAQLSRATGIHMILATQRPSVDVITGLIKANIPARVAFNVAGRVDSQVIIDQPGAEKLLGRGDMLYVPPDASKPMRVQGVYMSDGEITKLIDFLTKNGVEPQYTEEIINMPVAKLKGGVDSQDELYAEAVQIITQQDKASATLLQRKLSIGYSRAARILDQLEQVGVVGKADGSKPRDVLIKDADLILGTEKENTPRE